LIVMAQTGSGRYADTPTEGRSRRVPLAEV
jgi:hypothetical protein